MPIFLYDRTSRSVTVHVTALDRRVLPIGVETQRNKGWSLPP